MKDMTLFITLIFAAIAGIVIDIGLWIAIPMSLLFAGLGWLCLSWVIWNIVKTIWLKSKEKKIGKEAFEKFTLDYPGGEIEFAVVAIVAYYLTGGIVIPIICLLKVVSHRLMIIAAKMLKGMKDDIDPGST